MSEQGTGVITRRTNPPNRTSSQRPSLQTTGASYRLAEVVGIATFLAFFETLIFTYRVSVEGLCSCTYLCANSD